MRLRTTAKDEVCLAVRSRGEAMSVAKATANLLGYIVRVLRQDEEEFVLGLCSEQGHEIVVVKKVRIVKKRTRQERELSLLDEADRLIKIPASEVPEEDQREVFETLAKAHRVLRESGRENVALAHEIAQYVAELAGDYQRLS